MLANAILGGVNYVAEQAVKGEKVTRNRFAVSVAAGAISGLVGGSGAYTKIG